jgi:tRNA(Phe) wybutosine-synthesizing methylase Tyw3
MVECMICKSDVRVLNLTEKGMVCINCCWRYGLKIYKIPLKESGFWYLPDSVKKVLIEFCIEDLQRNCPLLPMFKNKKKKVLNPSKSKALSGFRGFK